MSKPDKRIGIATIARWFGIILVVLLLLTIGVLKMVEGSKEPLRLGLQDYLIKATGHPAEITALEETELFPDITFDLRDVIVRDRDDRNRTLLRAERAYISMSYWKRFFGIQDYNSVRFENMAIATDYLFPQRLDISFAGISDSEDGAYFVVEGRYNDRDLLSTAQMRRKGSRPPYSYDFKAPYPVTFKLGQTEMEGVMQAGFFSAGFGSLFLSSNGVKAELTEFERLSEDPLRIGFIGEMESGFFEGVLHFHGRDVSLQFFPLAETDERAAAQPARLKALAQGLRNDFGAVPVSEDRDVLWSVDVIDQLPIQKKSKDE